MTDPWANRIPLNTEMTVLKDAQAAMPGSTNGTLDSHTTGDSANSVDISNSIKTITTPENPTLSWGGIENPYPSKVPGTALD